MKLARIFLHLAQFSRLAACLVGVSVAAVLWLPFVSVKANRIALGDAYSLFQLIAQPSVQLLLLVLCVWALAALFVTSPRWRLLAALLGLLALVAALGDVSHHALTDTRVRVTAAPAFWLLLLAILLAATDARLSLGLSPLGKLLWLLLSAAAIGLVLKSPLLDGLAVMNEFRANQTQFWAQLLRHVQLTFGALAAGLLLGLPLGAACFLLPKIRQAVLYGLSLVQTIPSLALFGLLMVPLGFWAQNSAWARGVGISGTGAAPALIALILYNLFPIVANTVAGLHQVPAAVRDAARGLGLTRQQIFMQIDIPLAAPVVLTGVRVALVQTIGMVTVAAMIGGGGLGAFVFQGLGQTATDLVLLGALPTVFMAFFAATLLDILIQTISLRSKP
jgi:osmoprotectant transport system permease protein